MMSAPYAGQPMAQPASAKTVMQRNALFIFKGLEQEIRTNRHWLSECGLPHCPRLLTHNSSRPGLKENLIYLKIQDFAAVWRIRQTAILPPIPNQLFSKFRKPFTDRTVMTHVVTESCIRCRYTDCVKVCPVDCFREGPNFLAIDPDECIDCAVCVAECPVNAIYAEEDVPADQQQFIKMNVDLARKWPSITKSKSALPDAEEWKDVQDKLQYLER